MKVSIKFKKSVLTLEEKGSKDFGAKIGYCFTPNTNN